MKNIPELLSMKIIVLMIFSLLTQISLSQETYTSPLTEHYPSTELERIQRTIQFTKDTVFIKSETLNGVKTQKFVINEATVHSFPNNGLSRFYVCSSLDNIYITYFQIPITDKVEFIEVVQPSQYNRSANRYRFLID